MSADDLAHRLVAAYPDVWADGALAWIDTTPDYPGALRRERAERVYVSDDGAPCIVVVDGIDSGCEPLPDGARPCLDDPATAGILLARLKSVGAFVALTYGTNVKGQPVNHLRVWTGDGRLCSTPREFDGPTLGRACAAALLALKEPR